MRLGPTSGDSGEGGGSRRPRRRSSGGASRRPRPPRTQGAHPRRPAPPAPAAAPAPERAPEYAAVPAGSRQAVPAGPPPARPRPAPQPAAAPPPRRAAADGEPRYAQRLTTASIIGWTALSALLPGAAHLRAGRRRTAYILFGTFCAVLLGALAFAVANRNNVGIALRDSTLVTMMILAGVGAVAWFALVLSSYIVLRPQRLHSTGQIVSGIVVGVLCVTVMAPFAFVANGMSTTRDLANSIFPSDPEGKNAPIRHEDPWNGATRVNFLLIGGDAAGNRTGMRTDSMVVASVHIKTGNTVLFSLPRNLQHVRFPPHSPLARQFPNGFMAELPNGGLLNEVWQYAEDHPEIMGARHQGPRALMDAIGHTLNLKIDYYALINMYGFADLVDAIGGLRIRVERDIKWGGLYGTAGTIKAGYRLLSGEEALWYGRSRVGSDDFSRMARQRCVIGAFVKQATPQVILANFSRIATATKRLARSNIPRDLLEHLAELGLKVKNAKITSVQFVPPEFWPGSPDWTKIRRVTAKALRQSVQPDRRALAANVTAFPSAAATPTAVPSRVRPTHTPTPVQSISPTPTPNTEARSLSEVCGL